MSPVHIARASPADAPAILALQRLAFQTEAERYGPDIAPLTETPAELVAAVAAHTVLKAVDHGRIVGSVRAELHAGTCHVGRLSVHPGAGRRDVGTALRRAIEEAFPQAERFELFTGRRSQGNLRLYAGLGYRQIGARQVSAALTCVALEKARTGTGEPG